MRIARPRRPDVAFKRKRGPPPQATKLLTYTMVAGIVFIVLLGVVFLPQMFPPQAPVATPVRLLLNATDATRLDVISVGAVVPLSKLNATFLRDNVPIANLGPPLGGANGTFSFTDANGDEHLGPGDFFLVPAGSTGCHRLEVFQSDPRQLFRVGSVTWGGCPST